MRPVRDGVTPRVVALCLGFAALFAWLIPVVDYRFANTFLGAVHLPPGAVAALLVLVLVVNPALHCLSGRRGFTPNEILTVYLSCLFSCLVPGIGGNNYFVAFIIGPFYFATRENHWLELFRHLPRWMTPALRSDGSYNYHLVEGWYNGLGSGGAIPWSAWLLPLLCWGSLFVAMWTMLACLGVLLRAQWGEFEALSFPLLRLPVALAEGSLGEGGEGTRRRTSGAVPLLRNPLMWVGFGIAVAVQLLNGLNEYFPDVPRVPLELATGPLFTDAPWNQIGYTPFAVYPIAVGIAYLLTAEVGFSLWFFFWFFKLQLILAYYLGFSPANLPSIMPMGTKAFTGYQEVGGYLAFAASILWSARRHLSHIARRAIGRAGATPLEAAEPLSYPLAFWGLVAAFLFVMGWSIAAGIHPLLALALWVSYLVIAVVLARVVADGGLLFVSHIWLPLSALLHIFGSGPSSFLSPAHGIVPAALLEMCCIQDYRASLMPSFVQSFKLARDRRIPARPLLGLIAAVIAVAFVITVQMNVRLGYGYSGLQLQGWLSQSGPQLAGRNAASLAAGAPPDSPWGGFWMAVGAVVVSALMFARSRWPWFPLHPLGYVMAPAYATHVLWFSVFMGWLCKTLITRFGGHDSYRRVTPAFLGLAFGDVSMMLFWLLVDGWQGHTGHQMMPG